MAAKGEELKDVVSLFSLLAVPTTSVRGGEKDVIPDVMLCYGPQDQGSRHAG